MGYITTPNVKITLGTTEYENSLHTSVNVIRHECGFDTATVTLSDYLSDLYPSKVTANTAIEVEVKDESDSAYPTNPMFKGVVRFPVIPYSAAGELLILKCDGAGYGFGDTVCGQEYGSVSRNSGLDTASEILTDATYGLITKWVNKQMESAVASGFSYTTSIDANLTDSIRYLYFPYKHNNKAVGDICDLLSAIRIYASNTGPHWIVTTDDVFRMKRIATDDANWRKYYNGAAAGNESKLYQKVDFTEYHFEKMLPEANYVIYYGAWRRPSNGDAWTENNSASWAVVAPVGCTLADDSDAADIRVNSYSILVTGNSAVNDVGVVYPSTMNWSYDFSSFREYNVPHLNFWIKLQANWPSLDVRLYDAGGNSFDHTLWDGANGDITDSGRWTHVSLPIGDYCNVGSDYSGSSAGEVWTDAGAGWDDIDYIAFIADPANGLTMHIDGLHFGDASVCRVAYNSTKIASDNLKTKVITDDVGKDDTLASGVLGTTDTGLMARMAYAELLRCQDSNLAGWVKTKMLNDLLPGQIFQIYAKKAADGTYKINGTEMRVTKIIQDVSMAGATSTIYLTDDLQHSHPRSLYEDWNKVIQSAARPEFQDRQSSSMKAGQIDIRVPRYAEDYG